MGDPSTKKILFHMKPQLKILFANRILPAGELLDPRVCAWLLHSDKNKEKTLDELIEEYLSIKPVVVSGEDLMKKACLRVRNLFYLAIMLSLG